MSGLAAATESQPRAEYLRRCAWCEKALIRGNWLEEHDLPMDARILAVATHTICPRCMEELRRSGKSV